MDDRSIIMLLVEYNSTCAYKLYSLVTKKVEFNRDIIVKESKAWDWNQSQSKSNAVLTPELTFEDISDSERESASEGNLEYEDESESKSDSNVDE